MRGRFCFTLCCGMAVGLCLTACKSSTQLARSRQELLQCGAVQQLSWEANQNSYQLEQVWEYNADTLVRVTRRESTVLQQQQLTQQRADSCVAVAQEHTLQQSRSEVATLPTLLPSGAGGASWWYGLLLGLLLWCGWRGWRWWRKR